MTSGTILGLVTFTYLASAIFYLARLIAKKEIFGVIATYAGLAGLAAQTLALVMRWMESYQLGIGHAPLSNFYESLVFFAWSVAAIYYIVEFRTRDRGLGVFVIPLAFIALAYASLSPGVVSRIQPLVPALKSNWLLSHVVTCFLGYSFFALAFCLGALRLWKGRGGNPGDGGESRMGFLPPLEVIDELIYQNSFLGLIIFTLGIITGAVWAQRAWGSYWSWDPKETWSLVTWIVYAAMVHSRYVRGWKGRRIALMAVVGFAAVMFTYLGVNLLPGLHSYLK
jgi:cytochrome c-type biogenesis protein CcsB